MSNFKSIQTNEEIVKSIKRMNKIVREVYAQRRGFLNSEEYIASLQPQNIKKSDSKKPLKSTKHKVHVVDILDVSGSMGPNFGESKINAALDSINAGILGLTKEKLVDYTYSLTTFSTSNNIKFLAEQVDPNSMDKVFFHASGGTALYDAVGLTLQQLFSFKQVKDKVLVNIYTDGDENSSVKFNKKSVSNLIEKYQDYGFTVTFIGTVQDTAKAIKDLKINKSNTLSYDGTSAGLNKSMMTTNSLRATYASAVAKGEDVSFGFYKNIN